jgi:hypothetical protein
MAAMTSLENQEYYFSLTQVLNILMGISQYKAGVRTGRGNI